MNIHPAADLFPMMDAESHGRLKEDIRDNGQRESIKTLADQILDGRNRYRACQELGVEPRMEALPNDTDPIRYVVSLNLHCRHLDESQRAMVAGRIANMARGQAEGSPEWLISRWLRNQRIGRTSTEVTATTIAMVIKGWNATVMGFSPRLIRWTRAEPFPVIE